MEEEGEGLPIRKMKEKKRAKWKKKTKKQQVNEVKEQRKSNLGVVKFSNGAAYPHGPKDGGSVITEEANKTSNGESTRKRKGVNQRKETEMDEVIQVESEFKLQGKPPSLSEENALMRKSKFVVHVCRPGDVEKGRASLPIVMMEQEIMEAIQENPVIIVCGETGCGKTTQVPQFLYEAGYGSPNCAGRAGIIGVTQPRRVAVLSTARRVAHELNVQLGEEVGFQVRHDRKIGEKSCIKFMTDGILLRELQADFLLRKYSVIVLDEAHERSLNTDILIGMLSRIIPLRQKLHDQDSEIHKKRKLQDRVASFRDFSGVDPLKLIIMSATLRVQDFTANARMFPTPPPVLQVPARQFPVTVHFSKRTELLDYLGAAYKKVCAIHKNLPPGGILVFLTGQREVETLCRKLRRAFHRSNKLSGIRSEQEIVKSKCCPDAPGEGFFDINDKFGELNMETITAAVDGQAFENKLEKNGAGFMLSEGQSSEDDLPHYFSEDDYDNEMEIEENLADGEDALQKLRRSVYSLFVQTGSHQAETSHLQIDGIKHSDITDTRVQSSGVHGEHITETHAGPGPLLVLPLYAMLPAASQLRVFSVIPKEMRLVVVATNVAETSITIPGVRYVVDCGRSKEREIDRSSGISKYEVKWISKASADQRAGRAGRTGPGHCYRLYSSAHFNNSFPQFSVPEINKAAIEGVVLVMKCMGIDKVVNFPFPSPPDHMAVIEAERCLKSLSALSQQTGLLTPIGQAMTVYPISPRHSRMLLAAINGVQELAFKTGAANVGLALAYAVAAAAVLSLEDPFLREAVSMIEDEVLTESNDITGVRQRGGALEVGGGELGDSGTLEQENWLAEAEKAKRKQRRSKANAAHSKFRNATSDAISVANALRAYEQAEDPEGFCQFHFLHSKTMHEMSRLRKQLWDLVVTNSADTRGKLGFIAGERNTFIWNEDLLADSENCWLALSDSRLNTMQEELVRQAICAGWADKVSRRLSLQERATLPEIWSRRKVLAYRACSSEEPVFLHPSCPLSKEAPEFVVYNELVKTSRTYMRGVTAVESKWLVRQAGALCIFSKPLVDPPPWYDSLTDEVMCWVTPTFGPHLWDLPLHRIPMKQGKHRTAVFASSLLQGKVLPSFGSLSSYLTNDPSILLKPESQALKRVSELMYRLGNKVDTRAKLREVWATDAYFLYSEILSWVQSSHGMKLKAIWPQVMLEAQQTGKELYSKNKT